jgi:hypothetical protein
MAAAQQQIGAHAGAAGSRRARVDLAGGEGIGAGVSISPPPNPWNWNFVPSDQRLWTNGGAAEKCNCK